MAKKPRKTRIEIQRAYRECKKLEGDKTFLQRERERKSRESLGNSQAEEIKQGKGEALQRKRNTNQTTSNFDKRCETTQNDDCEDGFQSDKNGQVSHKSKVFISHELGHNLATVLAFIKELIPHLKKVMLPQIKHIHYYADSPTSQCRNKSIFYLLSHHKELFGVSASWNSFEAGHGNGPCDGVGGSVKLNAWPMKITIQDASDFFTWTQQHQSSSSVSAFPLCFQGDL